MIIKWQYSYDVIIANIPLKASAAYSPDADTGTMTTTPKTRQSSMKSSPMTSSEQPVTSLLPSRSWRQPIDRRTRKWNCKIHVVAEEIRDVMKLLLQHLLDDSTLIGQDDLDTRIQNRRLNNNLTCRSKRWAVIVLSRVRCRVNVKLSTGSSLSQLQLTRLTDTDRLLCWREGYSECALHATRRRPMSDWDATAQYRHFQWPTQCRFTLRRLL